MRHVFVADGGFAAHDHGNPPPEGFEMTETRARAVPVPMDVYRDVLGAEPGPDVRNLARTWAHAPALMKAQQPYRDHLHANRLPSRDQELAVLRIGRRCDSAYEFGQHTLIGKKAGLTDDEVAQVAHGDASDPGWSARDALVLRVTDELYDTNTLSDTTWESLTNTYDLEQIIELISVIGRYWTVSVVANALGVPLEENNPGFGR
jgi:4-carboxymuconolactone decarboxylase